MSRSNKPRYGTRSKYWKDTMLASRNQKKAWRKRKQIENQIQRRKAQAQLRTDLETLE